MNPGFVTPIKPVILFTIILIFILFLLFPIMPLIAWATVPNGDVNGDGAVNAGDVVLAQRIAMGLVTATPDQLSRGNVAPINAPDGVINAGDVVVIQRIAMGLINTWSITASAGANGTISPSDVVSVVSGATITFTITPVAGYGVAEVIVDGVSKGSITSYTFTNVTANHTILASFTANSYTITASAGANGTISPSGSVSVVSGATTTFIISPNIGYHVADVLVDGFSQGPITSYAFTSVNNNHTITASFAINTYTISATAGSSGSISPSGSVVVNYGSSQGFNITPSTGYHIDSVLVDGVSQGAITSYAFSNVTAAHTITVSFKINNYAISATAGNGGSISPSGSVGVNYGGNQSFAITPNTGYHILSVLVDGISQGVISSYTFTSVTVTHTIAASFENDTISALAVSSCQINVSWQDNATNENNYYVERATSPSGSWRVVETLGANVTSYQDTGLTQNTTYYYRVRSKTGNTYSGYTITASATTATLAAPTALSAVVASATQIDISWNDINYETSYSIERATSLNGQYKAVGTVGIDVTTFANTGLSAGTSYYYRVRAYDGTNYSAYSNVVNQTIRTITASAGSYGSITPSGTIGVANGGSQVFNIIPNSGYRISSVLVNGVSVGPVNTYTFSNVTANHTISASFVISTYAYNIAASAVGNGTISPSGIVGVNSGQTITFTMTPSTEHHVADLQVDGVSVGAGDTYTFTSVNADHMIIAVFALKIYTIDASSQNDGTISPSGLVNINSGANATFTITPNAGSSIIDVLVDGVSVGAVSTYSFPTVMANHTIAASFVDITLPSGSIVINNGATSTGSTAVTLALSATDNSGTVQSMQFSNDNTTWTSPEPYATTRAWALASGQGAKTVYAKFKDAVGNWSGSVSDTIILETTTPTNLSAIPLSNTSVRLTWQDNANTETRFDIERASNKAGPYAVVGAVGTDITTYTDNSLTTTTTYYYRVRAFNGYSYSAYSNIATYSNVSLDAVRYFYDNVGRLSRVVQGSTGVTYQYDAVGNLVSKTSMTVSPHAPEIQSISPDVLFIGSSTNVVIKGRHLLTMKQLFSDNPNLSIEILTILDTEIYAIITVPASVAPGPVNITLENLYGSASIQADMVSSTLVVSPTQLAITPGSTGALTMTVTPAIGKNITLPIINSNSSIVASPSEVVVSAAGTGTVTVTGLVEGYAEIETGGEKAVVFVTQPFTQLPGETVDTIAGAVSVMIDQPSVVTSAVAGGQVSVYIEPPNGNTMTVTPLVSAYIEPTNGNSMIVSPLVSAIINP